jgi:triacylglycerol lipase
MGIESSIKPRMRGPAVMGAVVAAVALLLPTAAGAGGSPPPRYPVPWTFAAAIPAGAENGPDVPPPGASTIQDPCKPSTEHPYPVILVHGLAADENDNWQTISPFLADNGYCVFALTYGNYASDPRPFDQFGGLTDMTASAQVLAGFVQQVLSTTGARKVDVVGHSEGGTMPDWYIKFDDGYKYVAHFVALSGVLHGTTFWGASSVYAYGKIYPEYESQFNAFVDRYCASCEEFLTGSAWMSQLDSTSARNSAPTCSADGADVEGVSYMSLATDNDELVRPPTSDFLASSCGNVDNILVQEQCPTDQADHLSIAADPVVAQDILNALDPAHQHRVRCAVVLPAVG